MKLNDKYGKLENGRLAFAPATLIDNGRYIVATTATDYLRLGWLPIVDVPPSEPAQDGYHWEATSWVNEVDRIVRLYTAVVNQQPSPIETYAYDEQTGLYHRLLAKRNKDGKTTLAIEQEGVQL